MKSEEIRGLTTEAIRAKLNDTREELMKLRFRKATGELTDTSRLSHTRRVIARLMTILKEREQADVMEGEK